MSEPSSSEQVWESLLSRNPAAIGETFRSLNDAERRSVLDHLHKMTTDPGWHTDQVVSAEIALQTIRNILK